MICSSCDYKKNAPEGICTLKNASDDLPIRCVGSWAQDKYFYLKRYLEIFTTAMRNKWELYYIDLFAGCGKCRVRKNGEEINGSALLSLLIKYPFKKYFMVELNPNSAGILKTRIETTPYKDRVHIIQGDCNTKIDEIISQIPEKSLSLGLIDPTGLHIKFDSLKKLTKDRKIDLIITFPEGMDIKRNLWRYIKQSHSILDDYMGDRNWRLLFPQDIRSLDQLTQDQIEKNLIKYYRENLNKLGYKEVKSGDEILIKSSQKRLPLYYLLFASKSQLGHQFWRKISMISPSGQRKLSLNNNPCNQVNVNLVLHSSLKPKIKFKNYKLLNGRIEKLVCRVNDGSIIIRFDKTPIPKNLNDIVCRHFLELKWAYGCPFDCSWCYLKGTFRFRPNGKEPVIKDYDKIERHTRAFLAEVAIPEILNTGEIADSLMFENGDNPFSKFIISIFGSQNIHKVLFLTKSSNIKNPLELESHNQAIMSFSLNAIPVADKWEKAPSVLKRLEAAQKLYKAGYEVRVRIDPMVPIENWKKHYFYLIDLIYEKFLPTRITLGSLRGLQSTINGCTDKSWTKYLSESSNWGEKIEKKLRYEMYSAIIQYLHQKYDYKNIGLCKETMHMWKMLNMEHKKIKCNCVW